MGEGIGRALSAAALIERSFCDAAGDEAAARGLFRARWRRAYRGRIGVGRLARAVLGGPLLSPVLHGLAYPAAARFLLPFFHRAPSEAA
jgi:hypothetical protein